MENKNIFFLPPKKKEAAQKKKMERALALSKQVDALSREVEASMREPTLQDVLDQMQRGALNQMQRAAPASTTRWDAVIAALVFFTALVELLAAWFRENQPAFLGAPSETR
jgi:hypothetical protein